MSRVIIALLWSALCLAACRAHEPRCPDDFSCKAPEQCIFGYCYECRRDADCATGKRCVRGTCRPDDSSQPEALDSGTAGAAGSQPDSVDGGAGTQEG